MIEGVEDHLLETPVPTHPCNKSGPAVLLSPLSCSHPAVGRLSRRKRRISISFNLSPLLTKSKSQFVYGGSSSSDDEDNLSK